MDETRTITDVAVNTRTCGGILSKYNMLKKLLYRWLLLLIVMGLLPPLYLIYAGFVSLIHGIIFLSTVLIITVSRLILPYEIRHSDMSQQLSRHRGHALVISGVTAFIILFVLSNYLHYPPSLGNDTWRDIFWSNLILSEGRSELVIHNAYLIPLIPLLYSLTSIILGSGPIDISVLLGALYLFLLVISVNLLSRLVFSRSSPPSSLAPLAQLLILAAIPWVSLWTVWFIPQAYSLMLSLFILLLILKRGPLAAITALLTAMIIAHPGLALTYIFFLSLLALTSRALKCAHTDQQLTELLSRVFIIATLLFLFYSTYTVVVSALLSGYRSILEALRALILGSEGLLVIQKKLTLGNPVSTAILGYGALSMLVALGILSWLRNTEESDERWATKEILLVYGFVLMALSYFAGALIPVTDAIRYLGMTAYVMLGIGSFTILHDMVKRFSGKIFTVVLIIMAVLSITLSGTLRPDLNPFNSGTAMFFIGKAPTWNEHDDLASLSLLIGSRNTKILTDYRTRLMLYKFILIPKAGEFQGLTRHLPYYIEYHLGNESVEVVSLGTYGYKLSIDDLGLFLSRRFIFIIREGTLDEMGLTTHLKENELLQVLNVEGSKVYASQIQAFVKVS